MENKSFAKITKRERRAIEVLKEGGYFRRQLERVYGGREQFVYRLHDAAGRVVPGFGFQTQNRLHQVGALRSRACASSTVWPSEWELAS